MNEWFTAGEQVAMGQGGRFPPLEDARAQRWWLGGFGAAWAASADERPVTVALAAALHGQEALLAPRRVPGGAPAGWGQP